MGTVRSVAVTPVAAGEETVPEGSGNTLLPDIGLSILGQLRMETLPNPAGIRI
ncbi:MAG: hypothetical protein RLY31_2206 [Bacteroidota bacterium]